MIQRRAAAAGYTAAQIDLLGGHSLRLGSSPRRSAPAPTPTPSRGRPVPRSEDARGLRPGVRAPGRQRGAEIGPVTTPVTSAGTAKPLSASTQAGYAADWALFADWCAATSVRLRSVDVAVAFCDFLQGPIAELITTVGLVRPVSPMIMWGNVASVVDSAITLIRTHRSDLDSTARAIAQAMFSATPASRHPRC